MLEPVPSFPISCLSQCGYLNRRGGPADWSAPRFTCARWVGHPHIAANVAAHSPASADYAVVGHPTVGTRMVGADDSYSLESAGAFDSPGSGKRR
jgi:hypothetical protein